MKRAKNRLTGLWKVLKTTVKSYLHNDTATLGAALAYHTVFSIAPVLVIVIAVAGFAFGEKAVQGEINAQAQGLIGKGSAEQIETMIKGAYRTGDSWWATAIAAVLLLVAATGVFGQLRKTLNFLWDVKPKPHSGYIKYLLDRVFSFAMVVCLAFLLLVSLVINAALVGVTKYMNGVMPGASVALLFVLEIILSFGLTTVLFAVIFKLMSDAIVQWRDVFAGALFTAVLFGIGKYAIGTYLGRTNVTDVYGVAGSLIVLLLWVFYSSQIVFLGAEFTQAYADARGAKIVPRDQAIRNVTVEIEKTRGGRSRVVEKPHAAKTAE